MCGAGTRRFRRGRALPPNVAPGANAPLLDSCPTPRRLPEASMLTRRVLCLAAAGTPLLAATAALSADDYPSRPIRVISPFPAGSASDTTGRVVVDQVSQIIGQP